MGLESLFHIESAATSTEEVSSPVYPLTRRKLAEHRINCTGKTIRQITCTDYDAVNLLIGMNRANLRNMNHICGDPDSKIRRLLDHTNPWYTLVSCISFAVYVGDYYHTDEAAVQAMVPHDSLSISRTGGDTIVFAPDESKVELIFYPGGKVEYTAYAPLVRACAEQGILCVLLLKMPCNLAVLDVNAADGIAGQYPEISPLYIGGCPLGGAMAAAYAAAHGDAFDGLILLAAYSTSDLRDTGLEVLSIYGTEDKVLDLEKYEKYRENLPAGAIETVIDGGCHSGFGCYGPQEGDGTPMISSEEQIVLAAREIVALVQNNLG